MKKFLMTCAAVMGVSLAFAATSFAATYTAEGNTVSIDKSKLTGLTADDQITVIVVKAEDGEIPTTINDSDILYINQEKNDLSFSKFQGMKLKGDSLDDGTYIIAVGCTTRLEEGIITDTFTVGGEEEPTPSYVKGDVDGVAGLTANDATLIAKHAAAGNVLTGTALLAADVDGVSGITANDATVVAKAVATGTPIE